MIFVTVGAQMSFDRLLRAVDAWAARNGRDDVFAQIGPAAWRPTHVDCTEFLSPEEFRARVSAADAVVAHAGMGSIITALELGKPVLIMPRRGDLGETRNDHQLATASRFGALPGVRVASDERELESQLDQLTTASGGPPIRPYASDELIGALRAFIHARADGKGGRR